jgi:predicted transcriptional regulator
MQLPVGKSSTTKDTIIQILSEDWPLTVKQIYERVQKKADKAITYQAVHKVVQELEKEKIVEKEGTGCKLNKDWIDKVKQYTEGLAQDYIANKGKNKPCDVEYLHLEFDTFLDAAKFVINRFYFEYSNPEKKVAVCFSYHIYAPFGMSSEEHENYKSMISQEEHWAVSKADTYLDRQFSNYLLGIGKKCISGADFVVKPETYVQGDYICQMFLPIECRKELDSIYENVTAMDKMKLDHYFDKVLCAKYKVPCIIFKDAKLAQIFREEFFRIKKEKGM